MRRRSETIEAVPHLSREATALAPSLRSEGYVVVAGGRRPRAAPVSDDLKG